MAIIALKAWYLEHYAPIKEIVKRPHDLRLSRNSLLKSGMRADFLDDAQAIQESVWFQRYLEGNLVEFYIEGSGGYAISNIDLLSHEIYFTKQDISAWLEPIVFLSCQNEYPQASEALRSALAEAIETFNRRSRFPITLEESLRSTDTTVRLSETQLRKIRKSLLFIADGTPIISIPQERQPQLILSPLVCVELGYALANKRAGQILLAQMERPDLIGKFSFDLPQHQQLIFKTATELNKTLPSMLKTLLQRFNLHS
ncbi:hypothetical protein NIES593_05920 [Hydrococcus rivularis NIES-593]|uniref:Uncharacterized protein n=1 Tax=Hydrococcus rivularis NIES-593 TaxID=1921803 RepID=A0A1U7HP09_9CYAN|nr:hypothetical protein [Hydrococcus rivularis]OKH25288.1 hypothetical protein NIES593_05920 [Hydrococcus rivularis NIES-593]